MQPAVSGLEQAFPGKIKAHNVDATTPESRRAVEDLGFQNHGLCVRSADGEVLFKQPDHKVKIEDVHKALAELLAQR